LTENCCMAAEQFDPGSLASTTLITIWVELRHPNKDHFPNTFVKERTAAKVEVEVIKDL